MAVHRNSNGSLDLQDFENHLKAPLRKEGYIEVIMYTPDLSVQINNVTSNDKLTSNGTTICDIDSITNLDNYTSSTVATLEENLWLLNGRFVIYQGRPIKGYISNTVSDENGDFETNPTMTVQLSNSSEVEDFSIILNSSVPSGYPKSIKIHCYDSNNDLLQTFTENIEWEDENGVHLLETLPSVNFEVNLNAVNYIIIEFVQTRFRHRRIRVSSIMFGKTIVLNQEQLLNVEFTDKTSYVSDTLPSRTFSFDVNNYEGLYNVDNPENGYIKLDKQTRIRFRNGYNVYGYEYNQDGTVKMEDELQYNTVEVPVTDEHGDPMYDEDGDPIVDYVTTTSVKRTNAFPVIDINADGIEIEWDNWKELRLMNVSANADESATFTCGSLLDVMEETYTTDIYQGGDRTVGAIATDVLNYEGFDLNSIEWSTDGIVTPTYDGGALLPYDQWTDTAYDEYKINTPIPEVSCKQVIQLLAFSVGATILIKDNGHLKFANLNINDSNSFTHCYQWNYNDFESIPAAEQLETVSKLSEISIPKYESTLDESGEINNVIGLDGYVYSHCSVLTTATCTAISNEVTYSDAYAIGVRLSNDNTSEILNAVTIGYAEVYSKRGIIQLVGFSTGDEVKVEILGYPVRTKTIQERTVTSDSLVLDTKIIKNDINTYTQAGTIDETEQIKRKYLEWYKKKFKYKITTRGEPLVNAGDYGVIQTQFTEEMPVYILQNHWTFDGTWSGDMEVIALD